MRGGTEKAKSCSGSPGLAQKYRSTSGASRELQCTPFTSQGPPPGLPLFSPKTTTFTCINSKDELGAGGPEMKKVWGSYSQNTHNLIGKIRHRKDKQIFKTATQ